MSSDASKDEILSSEEIEALVERANEPGFDDGEFRAHDFSGGQVFVDVQVDRVELAGREAC